MPLDTASLSHDDTIEMFRKRRKGAVRIWNNVPKEVFDMSQWKCRFTACALGWLAVEQYDGWRFGKLGDFGREPVHDEAGYAFKGAARYFGISLAQSWSCFGGGEVTRRFHKRWHINNVTPSDVAKRLLALPYVLPEE